MQARAPASGGRLKPDWSEARDDSGDVYYFNKRTGETTWETPAEVGHIDEATGRRFWVDRKGKSIWEPPKAMAWEEVIIPEGEPHAGYKYYHNSVSEETTWERPQALQWTQVHPEF